MAQQPLEYRAPERGVGAWIVFVILFAAVVLIGGPMAFYYSVPHTGSQIPLPTGRDPSLSVDSPMPPPATQP